MQPLIALTFVEQGPVSGRRDELTPGMTIGRADCDVLLADPDVSRQHAVVREIDGGLGIEDLGSTNGTYVDGERTEGVAVLQPGAEVRFGNTVWRIEPTGGATRVAQTPPRGGLVDSRPGPDATVASPTVEPESQTEQRGDVPPPDPTPSAVRPVVAPASGAPAAFSPESAGGSPRGSAARRLEATLMSYAIVIATAVALMVYFIQR